MKVKPGLTRCLSTDQDNPETTLAVTKIH